jgi:hypothetical protein
MIRVLSALAIVLAIDPSWAAPDCVLCRDQLKKTLEVCKSEPAGANEAVCREDAFREAKKCEKDNGGVCNFDLLMESPNKQPKP